jgi:hypothetical protein
MSYATIAVSATDPALVARIRSATVQEAWTVNGGATDYGQSVRVSDYNSAAMVWPVCVASDVEAAYESALAAGNPDPGGDPSVVTDGMILGAVQTRWPEDAAP